MQARSNVLKQFPKRIISRCIMHSKSCGVNRTSTIKLNLNIWSCDSYNLYLSRIHCFLMHHNCAWHIVSVIRVMYSLQVDHVSWQKRQRLLDYCNIIVLNSMVCFICDCVPIISLYLERFCLRSPYSHCYIEDRYIGVLSHTFYCNFCRDIEYSSLHREHRYIEDRYIGVPLYYYTYWGIQAAVFSRYLPNTTQSSSDVLWT